MKTLTKILGLVVILGIVSCDKEVAEQTAEGTVPQTVLNAFEKDHSAATNVTWGMDVEDGTYLVEFDEAGAEYEVEYSEAGEETAREWEIDLADLPSGVIAYVNKEYPGAAVEEAEKEVESGETTYEVEIEVDGKEIELEFDENGKFLEAEVEEEDEDDDKD